MNRHSPPSAPRDPFVEDLHGHRVSDPYRWLEADRDPRTRDHLAEQDAYFRTARATWPGRERWRQAVADRTQAQHATAPVARGARLFLLTQRGGSHAPVIVVADTAASTRHELDLASLLVGGTGVVRGFRPSWEGDRLVVMVSTSGSDLVTQHVLAAGTGKPVGPSLGPLPAARVAWLPGGEAFYYVAFRERYGDQGQGLDLRVRLHHVGSDPGTDPVVFPAGVEPGRYYGLTIDPAGRWLAVTVSHGAVSHNALWLARLGADPSAPAWRQAVADDLGAAVAPRFGPDGRLYLLTDHGAPRGRVCAADPGRPLPELWRDVVAEDAEAVLDDCALLERDGAPVVLALRTRHGVSELSLHDRAGGAPPTGVDLPGAGIAGSLRSRPEGGSEAWLVYSDFATPAAVHRFDVRTHVLARWPAGPGARTDATRTAGTPAVRSRLVEYPARDGTVVRMFLITPDGPSPGPRPTILSGYGGFGVPLRPVYSPVILAWVAAGGQYAMACVRGGGEEGAAWHLAGRGRNKTVAVDDFNAAAEWLIRHGHSAPGMLAAAGASHGGFLVAAAAMRRPELYAGVLCADPLLDMVRYEQLGIGATWTEEFGTAAEPQQLADLLAISPYHQVRPGTAYPGFLFSGGTEDPRLGAAHVRKMCAALQHATSGTSPVLLRCEDGVGHGTRTADSVLELNTDTLAFLATQTSLRPPGAPPAEAVPGQLAGPATRSGVSGRAPVSRP